MAMFFRRLRVFFIALSNLRDRELRLALVLVVVTLLWLANLWQISWSGRTSLLAAAAIGPLLTLGGYVGGMLWPYWRRNWVVRLGAIETIAATAWIWQSTPSSTALALTWQPVLVALMMVYYHEVKSIFPSPQGKRLRAGDALPDFALLDSDGKNVTAKIALADGPVLFIFYRGDW